MKYKKLLPIIGIIILIYILTTLDFEKIIAIFSKINPFYSALSFLALIPLFVLGAIEWQILLRKQKIHVRFWYPIKNFFIGYFYGSITPGAVGSYVRSLYLSDESGAPLPKCISNIIIFSTLEFIALLTVGAIGAIYLSSVYPYLFYIIVIVVIVQLGVFLFFFKDKRSRILFRKIVQSSIFSTIKDRIEGSIETFFEDIPKFKDVLLPFGISLFSWFLRYVLLFFIAKIFFIEIPIIPFVMIVAVADVLACLPISIYGLGTREAALITLFGFWGVPSENIVSLSLFWFVIMWLTPSVIGAFVTVTETKKYQKFKLTDKTINKFVKYVRKYPQFYSHTSDIVKKNIPRKVDKPVIIDLGAGPGFLSSEIAKKAPKAQIIAVDPSDEMLEYAKKEVKSENFKTLIGSSDNIPVADDLADIVVSRFNLTYWEKPRECFEEIDRVLKPGGKIIIEALNKNLSGFKLFLIKIRMLYKLAGSQVIKYHADAYKTAYRLKDVEVFLKKIGYKITYKKIDEKEWKFIIIAKKVIHNNI